MHARMEQVNYRRDFEKASKSRLVIIFRHVQLSCDCIFSDIDIREVLTGRPLGLRLYTFTQPAENRLKAPTPHEPNQLIKNIKQFSNSENWFYGSKCQIKPKLRYNSS